MMNWNSEQFFKKILIGFAEFNALVMQIVTATVKE